jgi:hypothetical protein
MPVKYSEKSTCKNCKKRFEWMWFELISNRATDYSYRAEVIPSGVKAHVFQPNNNGGYDAKVYCPICGYENHFLVIQSDYDNYNE